MTKGIFHLCVVTSGDELFMIWHNERQQWEFAGGKHDLGETMLESIKRELEEEIGLTCKPNLIGVTDYDDKWVMGVWHTDMAKIDLKCMESKHSYPTWFKMNNLPVLSNKTRLALDYLMRIK